MPKLQKLHSELFPHPPYSSDLAPSDYYLLEELKRMLQEKRFGFNEKVITETEAYFKAKDKLFYEKGIEMVQKRWNECITVERDYVDK